MGSDMKATNYYCLNQFVAAGYPRLNNQNFEESMYGPEGRCPECGYVGPALGTLILGASDTPKAPFWKPMSEIPFEMVSAGLAEHIRERFPEATMRPTGKKSAKAPDSFVLIPDVLPVKIWDPAKLTRRHARRMGFPPLHCKICGNNRLCGPSYIEVFPATQWPADQQGPLVCTYEQFGDRDAVFSFRQNLYRGDLAQLVTEASRRKLEWELIADPDELPAVET